MNLIQENIGEHQEIEAGTIITIIITIINLREVEVGNIGDIFTADDDPKAVRINMQEAILERIVIMEGLEIVEDQEVILDSEIVRVESLQKVVEKSMLLLLLENGMKTILTFSLRLIDQELIEKESRGVFMILFKLQCLIIHLSSKNLSTKEVSIIRVQLHLHLQ